MHWIDLYVLADHRRLVPATELQLEGLAQKGLTRFVLVEGDHFVRGLARRIECAWTKSEQGWGIWRGLRSHRGHASKVGAGLATRTVRTRVAESMQAFERSDSGSLHSLDPLQRAAW